MSVDLAAMATWDDEELLRQFESRVSLQAQMVGTLYPSILHDENEVIGQEAIRRRGFHPNWWREKRFVHTSWTDGGLVHDPFGPRCPTTDLMVVLTSMYDCPAQAYTCLWCMAR